MLPFRSVSSFRRVSAVQYVCFHGVWMALVIFKWSPLKKSLTKLFCHRQALAEFEMYRQRMEDSQLCTEAQHTQRVVSMSREVRARAHSCTRAHKRTRANARTRPCKLHWFYLDCTSKMCFCFERSLKGGNCGKHNIWLFDSRASKAETISNNDIIVSKNNCKNISTIPYSCENPFFSNISQYFKLQKTSNQSQFWKENVGFWNLLVYSQDCYNKKFTVLYLMCYQAVTVTFSEK